MNEGFTSIFQTEWWCDASNPGSWDKVEISAGGEATAQLIYSRQKKYGFQEVGMPYLARVMEPYVTTPEAKFTTQLSGEIGLLSAVTAKLPSFDHFWYTLPPESALELAFNLSGFMTEGQYTFRRHPDETQSAWESMDRKTRNHVRAGLRDFQVEKHSKIDRFIALSKSFVGGKTWVNNVDYPAIERIFDACDARGQAVVLTAVDQDGKDVASTVLVWDQRILYYWLSARDPVKAMGNANSALIWSAIQLAGEKGLIFDMDGYASPASGVFYAKFGLKPHRRIHVTRLTTLTQWAANSRLLIKSLAPVKLKTVLQRRLAGKVV